MTSSSGRAISSISRSGSVRYQWRDSICIRSVDAVKVFTCVRTPIILAALALLVIGIASFLFTPRWGLYSENASSNAMGGSSPPSFCSLGGEFAGTNFSESLKSAMVIMCWILIRPQTASRHVRLRLILIVVVLSC